MAFTTCIKCEGRFFALQEQSPIGSRFKVNVIQCSQCGTPIGVMEWYDSGVLVKGQAKALKEMDQRLQNIESTLGSIVHALRQIQIGFR